MKTKDESTPMPHRAAEWRIAPWSVEANDAALPAKGRARRKAIRALAVLLFAGGAGLAVHRSAPWRRAPADLSTAAGERRTLDFGDGVRVVLNSGTAINLSEQSGERRLQLVEGEILVATEAPVGLHGVVRPTLVVVTREGEMRPLGTRFAVRHLPDESRLDVFEGAVAVRTRSNDRPSVLVKAGERLHFNRHTDDIVPPSQVGQAR